MLKILQRYVLRDVSRTFLLAIGIFTGIVLLGLVYQFVRAELSLRQMLALVPYGLPFTLPFTLPVAALLATSLTFGRLAVDNEIDAMRTSGISLALILSPVLILGLLLSASSLYLQDQVIPPFHYKIHNLRMLAAEVLLHQNETYNFRRSFGPFQVYASYARGNEYHGLVVFQNLKDQRMKFVARRGVIRIGEDGGSLVLTLYDGSWTDYNPDPGGTLEGPLRASFPRFEIPIPIRSRSMRESDKPTGQLLREASYHQEEAREGSVARQEEIRKLEGRLDRIEGRIHDVEDPGRRLAMEREREEIRRGLRWLRGAPERSEEAWRKNVTEVNRRGSLAFACLISVIFGATLPVFMAARNPLVPFFAGTLIVIVFYFPLHRLGVVLGEEGPLNPWVAPWIPDALVGTLGAFLLRKVLRR